MPVKFGKNAILKDENVFSSKKNTFSSSYFLIFPTFEVFCFRPKNFIMKAEKTFSRNITIWYSFVSKFATFIDFEKKSVFFKKPFYFSWKTQTLNVLRNLTISVVFATIWLTKLSFRHVNNRCWLVYTSSIGKHRVKKMHLFERKILLTIVLIWHQITKFVQNEHYGLATRQVKSVNRTSESARKWTKLKHLKIQVKH